MASDGTPPVNGIYGGQYGSPAELPAPTSGPSHAPSASQSTTASTTTAATADPQEIGWYFVEQYYTTLSKNPERIHLFYSKKSQLVIGVEAEKVVPSVGVKAISEKIKKLDISDCKVRVLNVDSQASYQNIVVQVIGEMSNKSEPHHRFVQTFVLAEQPNGYFVLNDIFRYLNDDEDEIIEDEPAPASVGAEQEQPVAPTGEVEKPQEDVVDETAAEEVDAKLEDVKAEQEQEQEEEQPGTNGVASEAAIEPSPSTENPPETTKDVFEESAKAAVEEPSLAPTATEKPQEPEPTRSASPAKPADPAPASDAPPAKKTWANMVGAKATVVPSVPAPTASAAPTQPKPSKSPQPPAAPSTTSEAAVSPTTQGNGWQTADHGKKQNKPQAKPSAEQNVLAYIKNVNEKIQASELRAELEKYGELRYFDVSRQRNCAFVEFADAAGYNAAVAANPHTIGTEQVSVEERRPRPNAFGGSNASFGRGGASVGRGRGGLQGRGGSQGAGFQKDAGRGTFQPRGSKSGNVTPKGRGQPQAA